MRLLTVEFGESSRLAHYSNKLNIMGYIKELRTELADKLASLSEEKRNEIINYVADVTLQSYKNGQKAKKVVKDAVRAVKNTSAKGS